MMPRAELPVVTDGTIYTVNMMTALQHQWGQFHRSPHAGGATEAILDGELARVQFFGDFLALDRLVEFASTLLQTRPLQPQSHMVAARVDAARHEFSSARRRLDQAITLGAGSADAMRLLLSIDQATGSDLVTLLAARERNLASGSVSDFAALGALLAESGDHEAAERVYEDGLRTYADASPAGPAWLCFQLGVLWGETAADTDPEKAEYWYQSAVDYLPGYVSASVHLTELMIEQGRFDAADDLLSNVMASGDPEVHWRLSDLMTARGDLPGASHAVAIASAMYDELLQRHCLAFADHAAEFFMDIDTEKALRLALRNLENRDTPRARQLVQEAAQVVKKSARLHKHEADVVN